MVDVDWGAVFIKLTKQHGYPEDMIQEALCVAMERAAAGMEFRDPSAYVASVARNLNWKEKAPKLKTCSLTDIEQKDQMGWQIPLSFGFIPSAEAQCIASENAWIKKCVKQTWQEKIQGAKSKEMRAYWRKKYRAELRKKLDQ